MLIPAQVRGISSLEAEVIGSREPSMWDLGIELESHAKLVHYFNHGTISPALVVLFDLTFPDWLYLLTEAPRVRSK